MIWTSGYREFTVLKIITSKITHKLPWRQNKNKTKVCSTRIVYSAPYLQSFPKHWCYDVLNHILIVGHRAGVELEHRYTDNFVVSLDFLNDMTHLAFLICKPSWVSHSCPALPSVLLFRFVLETQYHYTIYLAYYWYKYIIYIYIYFT